MVIVRRAPPTSALMRHLDPEAVAWTLEAHLLASVIDVLNIANWQRIGKKGAPRPKPIPRPGAAGDPDVERLGKDPLPVDEMADWLGGAFAAAA